jgi:Concanavalin A-like lectin/glucanases superfamily
MSWTEHPSRGLTIALALAGLSLVGQVRAGGYEAEVRKDGPVAWWRFQESSGAAATVADASGKHPGTRHGRMTLEQGPVGIGGRAARFDGEGAFLSVPHHAEFESASVSVEFWFKTTQPWQDRQWPGSATLVTKATAGAASGDWTINGGSTRPGENQGRVIASCGPIGGGDDVNTVSPGGSNDGRWHHLVWTRSEEGTNRLFLDGRQGDEAEDNGGPIVNDRPIQIGGDPHQNGRFFQGSLAEVAVFRTVISPERVRAHALAGGLTVSREVAGAAQVKPVESLSLANDAGVAWELLRTEPGWALGRVLVHGKPLEGPATGGILCLRQVTTGEVRWLPAQTVERQGPTRARLSGQAVVQGVTLRFSSEITLPPGLPAARWTTEFSVDKVLEGWEVCLAPWDQPAHDWRCWLYPFAGNSRSVSVTPLRYCGAPAAIVYRPDLSIVALFGIDPTSDYLNPNTWTGKTAFHFQSRKTPPEFRFGGGRLSPGERYHVPLQILATDAGTFPATVTGLVRSWIKLNSYQVEPLHVRAPEEAVSLFVAGRRASRMWQPGKGYQIQDAWPVIYLPESPINAYLDYLLYEQTGDRLWRDRAFQVMDFFKGAQHSDPSEPRFGAVESHFDLRDRTSSSTDRGGNPGLKPDMNAFAARYTLLLWQRIKQREGLDRRDWYETGVRMADWVVRQQRPDGGLPQVVGPDALRNAVSVVSGRALVALPVVRRITGNARFDSFIERHERFVRRQVEDRLWFTGAHTDLPPQDFESDSVWQVVEYWLDKYESTRQRDALEHAEANALLAFLMMCPKQLPWVANPTQTCHAEQQHFLQYSNYCYTNAKIACLHRLAGFTGQDLYRQLRDRIVQCGFWCQEPAGPWMGSVYERMSDPWLGVSRDVNSKGTRYMSELAVDLNVQLLERKLARVRPAAGRREGDPPKGK